MLTVCYCTQPTHDIYLNYADFKIMLHLTTGYSYIVVLSIKSFCIPSKHMITCPIMSITKLFS